MLLTADHYGVSISKQLKQKMKTGIFVEVQSLSISPEWSKQSFDEILKLKELELESQRLVFKNEALQYLKDLKMKRLEQEYCFRELGIGKVSL